MPIYLPNDSFGVLFASSKQDFDEAVGAAIITDRIRIVLWSVLGLRGSNLLKLGFEPDGADHQDYASVYGVKSFPRLLYDL